MKKLTLSLVFFIGIFLISFLFSIQENLVKDVSFKKYKVLILWSGLGEYEWAKRLEQTSRKIGWECEIRLGEIQLGGFEQCCLTGGGGELINQEKNSETLPDLIKRFNPDFIVSLRDENIFTTKIPNYLAISGSNVKQMLPQPNSGNKIGDFDAYLIAGRSFDYLKSFTEASGKKFHGIHWYPSVGKTEYEPVVPKKIFYCGFQWDGKRNGSEYTKMFSLLDLKGYLVVYGPIHRWTCAPNSVQGLLPFDGESIKKAIREAGICLVLHASPHLALGAPSSRIFEAAASCSIIISDKNPFVVQEFGDSVLYIEESDNGEDLFKQVDAHVQWIFSHPKEAEALAKKAHAIFIEKFTLEKQLDDLGQLHQSVLDNRSDLSSYVVDDREEWCLRQDLLDGKIRLLKMGIEEEPEDESRLFHLAQAYKLKSEWTKALDWYKKRLEKGGNDEEKWYSKFKIAEIYDILNNWKLALQWYLEAYHDDPSRAEPIQRLAAYYRREGQPALAYHFAKLGKTIPLPDPSRLFVSYAVYDYQFDQEISIVSYYLHFFQEGLDALNRLIQNEKVPISVKEQAIANLVFYREINTLSNEGDSSNP
ncbi:MAG: hypothetical protein ACH350_02050 [Parachlamydiaceae bacterium]